MITWPAKDPNEVLDYEFDWADEETGPRLVTGETLLSSDFSVVEGDVVIDSEDFEATGITTVWLSGGTAGTLCKILNRVTTSGGRTYDQTAKLRIRDK
jgi:hypothetical protein